MKPVACAIDILQRDDVFLGHLLPTISVLERRLEHLKITGLKYCAPLVDALLKGTHERYASRRFWLLLYVFYSVLRAQLRILLFKHDTAAWHVTVLKILLADLIPCLTTGSRCSLLL